jgi:hypothetical protein
MLYNGLSRFLARLLYTNLLLSSGADEVSGYSWQLITAIGDRGDGLTICG